MSRPARATKKALRYEITQLRHIGTQMANLCFNLAQRGEMRDGNRETMDDLRRQWDAIDRSEINGAVPPRLAGKEKAQ